nr:hypothetical protein [uncultured Pseudomonas sp.]
MTLLAQLAGGIEYLQAGAAAYRALGNGKLGQVHAETGAAVRALGHEAFGHASSDGRRAAKTGQ